MVFIIIIFVSIFRENSSLSLSKNLKNAKNVVCVSLQKTFARHSNKLDFLMFYVNVLCFFFLFVRRLVNSCF